MTNYKKTSFFNYTSKVGSLINSDYLFGGILFLFDLNKYSEKCYLENRIIIN